MYWRFHCNLYLEIEIVGEVTKLSPEEDPVAGINGRVLNTQFPGRVRYSETEEHKQEESQESGHDGEEADGEEYLPVANSVKSLLHY